MSNARRLTLAVVLLLALPAADAAALLCTPGRSSCLVAPRVSARLRRLNARVLRRPVQERTYGTVPTCGNGRVDRSEECDDGNAVDGDGCSSICIAVPEPVRRGFLQIEELPVPDSAVVPGQTDVLLFAFRVTAGRQDVRLQGLTLKADEGSLRSLQNIRAYAGGLPISPAAQATTTTATLQRITQILPVLDTMLIEVRGNVRPGASDPAVSLTFATDHADYVRASGVEDGRELTGIDTDGGECGGDICWITVRTAQ